MDYTEFKRIQDIKWENERRRTEAKANKAYNKGLWEGLSLMNKIYYPFLKRKEKYKEIII